MRVARYEPCFCGAGKFKGVKNKISPHARRAFRSGDGAERPEGTERIIVLRRF